MKEEDLQWYYNLETHAVEQGLNSRFENRMGPYKTKEAAAHALEIAKHRNEIADAQVEDHWKD